MPPVFKSGAFIQQCFAVHPRCLDFKSVKLPDRLVLKCTSCRMHHHLALRAIIARSSALADSSELPVDPAQSSSSEILAHCLTVHTTSVTIRAMDVVQDLVGLRCRECRRLFDLEITSFETHQL